MYALQEDSIYYVDTKAPLSKLRRGCVRTVFVEEIPATRTEHQAVARMSGLLRQLELDETGREQRYRGQQQQTSHIAGEFR